MIHKLKIEIRRNSFWIWGFEGPKGKDRTRCTSWTLWKSICNQYDFRWKIYRTTMDFYNYEKKLLKLPIGYGLDNIITHFNQSIHDITYEIEDKSGKYIDYNLTNVKLKEKYKPRNEIQENAIKFLTSCMDENQFHQLFLSLTTGSGKTFCAIYSIVKLRLPAIIITYNLSDQWKEKILEYTTVKESDIFELKGRESIIEILSSKKVYPFYIASVSTLRNLLKNYQDLNIIFNKLKVAITIFDEAHIQFKSNSCVSINSDTRFTYYLSATPSRSNYQEKRVFNNIFAKVPIHGISTHKLDNHYKIRFVKYNTYPTPFEIKSCITTKGFSAVQYFKYLYSTEERSLLIIGMIKYFADQLLNLHPKNKILVFMPTLDFMHYTAKILSRYRLNYTIGEYNSNIKNLQTRERELDKNLILTTIAACSTGKDIPNLKAIFSLTPFSSAVIARQILGRLRKLPDGGDAYFYDFTDVGFPQCIMQCNLRTNIFKERCQSMIKKEIVSKDMILYLKEI